ncbi:MAG: hypothetical protein IIA83_07930 [Thaumarchaeota archaeon]|nr:hypothetical protein [Nitrososphaerota archaeon]
MNKNQDCLPKKRIIYKPDGTFRSDGTHIVRNWIGVYEHFFDVVLGKPTSYHVKPLWKKRYIKVGHNLIRIKSI